MRSLVRSVPWAPPNSNPVITGVWAPPGDLNWGQYLDLMSGRVARMVEEAGEEKARSQLEAALPPEMSEFLNNPPDRWAHDLVKHPSDLVEAGLGNNLPPNSFPAQVKGPPPGVQQALEKTSLENWLALVIPREQDP